MNFRKTNKRREELGLLYICQQSWNPKQAITLKHIIAYSNLRTYINPKGMIGMPVTGHHVWDHAYGHDRVLIPTQHLLWWKKNTLLKNLFFWQLVTSNVDYFASFHHSMLYLFNFTSLIKICIIIQFQTLMIWNSFLNTKNWFLIFKHMDVIHTYLIPYDLSMEMHYKRVSKSCSL
jgi:hypothetical protein